MFYGVRLLFCTYKEGTVIREQLVAGEKKRVPKEEYTVLLKYPIHIVGKRMCQQVWDISLGHDIVRSITSLGWGRSVVATWTGRGGCRRSFRLDLLSLSGTEGDMVPSLEYEWQAHAVRRAEAVSDMISEGMEMGLPTLLSQ